MDSEIGFNFKSKIGAAVDNEAASEGPTSTRRGRCELRAHVLGDRGGTDKAAAEPEGNIGIIKYVGEVKWAKGRYAGVQFHGRVGRHGGEVKGVKYFSCPPGHGLYIPVQKPQQQQQVATSLLPPPQLQPGQQSGQQGQSLQQQPEQLPYQPQQPAQPVEPPYADFPPPPSEPRPAEFPESTSKNKPPPPQPYYPQQQQAQQADAETSTTDIDSSMPQHEVAPGWTATYTPQLVVEVPKVASNPTLPLNEMVPGLKSSKTAPLRSDDKTMTIRVFVIAEQGNPEWQQEVCRGIERLIEAKPVFLEQKEIEDGNNGTAVMMVVQVPWTSGVSLAETHGLLCALKSEVGGPLVLRCTVDGYTTAAEKDDEKQRLFRPLRAECPRPGPLRMKQQPGRDARQALRTQERGGRAPGAAKHGRWLDDGHGEGGPGSTALCKFSRSILHPKHQLKTCIGSYVCQELHRLTALGIATTLIDRGCHWCVRQKGTAMGYYQEFQTEVPNSDEPKVVIGLTTMDVCILGERETMPEMQVVAMVESLTGVKAVAQNMEPLSTIRYGLVWAVRMQLSGQKSKQQRAALGGEPPRLDGRSRRGQKPDLVNFKSRLQADVSFIVLDIFLNGAEMSSSLAHTAAGRDPRLHCKLCGFKTTEEKLRGESDSLLCGGCRHHLERRSPDDVCNDTYTCRIYRSCTWEGDEVAIDRGIVPEVRLGPRYQAVARGPPEAAAAAAEDDGKEGAATAQDEEDVEGD
ncbi:unnamed protein product, partial [Mesorhabditis spiculigera]